MTEQIDQAENDFSRRHPFKNQASTKDLWVLLWSRKQGFLHIENAFETITTGLEMLHDVSKLNDYIVIFIGTRAEVDEMAKAARPQVNRQRITDGKGLPPL